MWAVMHFRSVPGLRDQTDEKVPKKRSTVGSPKHVGSMVEFHRLRQRLTVDGMMMGLGKLKEPGGKILIAVDFIGRNKKKITI
jgi:predicted NUDIX family NTP pyrophosphohydrolase